jgi:SWIM/SEC-C metal-binding protein
VASLGTRKKPAIVRVQTEQRAQQVLEFCADNEIVVMVGLEPDKPEDITDIERAILAGQPARAAPKIGRNEPCPCGSGKKFKKCCVDHPPRDCRRKRRKLSQNTLSMTFHMAMGFRAEPGTEGVGPVPAKADYDGPGVHRVAFVLDLTLPK